MQPLVSPVDHESRQSSHRTIDQDEISSEATPLLRFPRPSVTVRNPVTTAVVSILLIILIVGVIIGIYLLILQDRSENILPPVEGALRLVSRQQWSPAEYSPLLHLSTFKATEVIVVETNTDPCDTTKSCEGLLQQMEVTGNGSKPLPYNFLVSSDGQIYEALGWHSPSRLFPEYGSALVLAFIGSFSQVSPTNEQVAASKLFFDESERRKNLDPSFTIIGKTTKEFPKFLFLSLKNLPQWNSDLSDVI